MWIASSDDSFSRFGHDPSRRAERSSELSSSTARERLASSSAPRSTLRMACMTVVWSRRLKASAIAGSERSVSSRVRYMASWRARAIGAVRVGERMASTLRLEAGGDGLLDLSGVGLGRRRWGELAGRKGPLDRIRG